MTDSDEGGHWESVAMFAEGAALGSAAFDALYEDFHDPVRRTLGCLGVPAAALDDALQEVFVVVHRRMGDPSKYESVKGWIYAVARRVAWRHLRTEGRQRQRIGQLGHLMPEDQALDDSVARTEALAFVAEFLDTLEAEQREVFVLAELEQLTAPEIATIVGARLNTVYSRLRLARGRFAAAVARRKAREGREAEYGSR